jgi:3-hydroxy acid dehydrogenase / malonic semialdehyde reductase
MERMKNKIVLITGASSGIGKACAEAFANEKANLILAARRIGRLTKIADSLEKKFGIKTRTLELDVRNISAVKKSIGSLGKEWEKIDILINNAGLARGFNKVYEGEIDNWEEMIDTNLKGLLYISRSVLPGMVERKKGHVINIGSTAGHEVYPNGNVYCATKFAVNALTKAIRMDCLEHRIKVSTVDPGMVETEFSIVRFSGDKNRADKVYEGLSPLVAKDIADAVVYCATRPAHVNINEIILTPLAQASSTQVIRK